jgi:TM2 domain-containing membrane protein YozV
MPTAAPPAKTPPPGTRPPDPLAALLSLVIPGLGQVYQGRVAKGVLFLVCIYTLFFYGMYLGSGTVTVNGTTYTVTGNVYLPKTARKNNTLNLPEFAADLYNRPHYLGQFWAGLVAWPALWHYFTDDDRAVRGDSFLSNYEREPSDTALNALHTTGDKRLELGWVYTVIAGVLNILVIYDALAGPAFLLASGGEAAGDQQPGGQPSRREAVA